MPIYLLRSYQFRDASWVWENSREGVESSMGKVVDVANEVLGRFEGRLKYYEFKANGFEIMIDKICFPINGSDTVDITKKALALESFQFFRTGSCFGDGKE